MGHGLPAGCGDVRPLGRVGTHRILWWSRFAIGIGAAWLAFFAAVGACSAAFPLSRSENGRYLVDQDGAPWLIKGDAPQGAFTAISSNTYVWLIANRAASGFNALWIQLLANGAMGGRGDGSLFDGTVPFLGSIAGEYDFAQPNERYFAYVDWALRVAETNGIAVFLNPCEMIGWADTLRANGIENCRRYGQYLGLRYQSTANIVWFFGNDYQTWTDLDDDDRLRAIAEGIREHDRAHLLTLMLNYPVSSSVDNSRWRDLVDLNCSYTYGPTYQEVHRAYSHPGPIPCFMGEAHYEGEEIWGLFGTPLVLRMQEWWSATAGACGQFIGSINWAFARKWQNFLNAAGTTQFGYLNVFLSSRRWWDLVPETNSVFLVGGAGEYDVGFGGTADSDYATTAWLEDRTLAICYVPTRRTVTVDLLELAGPTTVRWFDPAGGVYFAVDGSPFTDGGIHDFAPPGNNADGDGDWVLVLETQVAAPDPPLVVIEAPADGAIVADEVVLSAASDAPDGLAGVRFYVDGVALGPEISWPPFAVRWNTFNWSNGVHQVQAIARGRNFERATNEVSVFATNPPVSASLVAALGFDEGIGQIAWDGSSRHNDGTIGRAEWEPVGKYGGSLSFDGGALATVPGSASLDLTNGLTLEAWVYPTGVPPAWSTVVLKEASGSGAYALQFLEDGEGLRAEASVRTLHGLWSARSPGVVPMNAWTHLAATYDGLSIRLFIDGVETDSALAPGNIVASPGALRIGGNEIWGEHFAGKIDEVRVYARSQSAGAILEDMQRPIHTGPELFLLAPGQAAGDLERNGFKLLLNATGPTEVTIERSTNLVSWQPIESIRYSGGTVEITDSNQPPALQQFYRARRQP